MQPQSVETLQCGDVALLKGDRCTGNQYKGMVQRSPKDAKESYRLLLTLDFVH